MTERETRIYAGKTVNDLMDITEAYAGFLLEFTRLEEENKELREIIEESLGPLDEVRQKRI